MKELHLLALDYRCAVLPDDAHEAWIELEKYVKQLINEEREACAKVAEDTGNISGNMNKTWRNGCFDVAFAIRERGAP